MKKILGITIGGLQAKTARLVLIMIFITIGMFTAVSIYQNRMLVSVVQGARDKQTEEISRTSQEGMYRLLEQSILRTTALQAENANNDFAEVINDIYMMQTMAEGILANRDHLDPVSVSPPDPALDGIPTVHVLWEEGVDYTKSETLGIIAHLGTPLLALYRNCSKITSCYIGLADGTHLSVDSHLANRFDENGVQIPYPVRHRPWYVGAVQTGGLFLTGMEEDAFSGLPCITCSLPFYVDGELIGVVGMDVSLENMAASVHKSDSNGISFIVNNNGQVILAPEDNGIFTVTTADQAQDLRTLGNEPLTSFVNTALTEPTELTPITLNGIRYQFAGAPLTDVGWAVITVVSQDIIEKAPMQLLNTLDRINTESRAAFRNGTAQTSKTVIFMLAVILAGGILAARYTAGKIVKPIEEMTRNIIDSSRTGRLFEMKDCYRTDDEIEVLATSFADLSRKTKKYIEDITTITKEKERISTELELARKIQADMMPYIYPAFPDRPEFDIYATMNPAREVGGDFYDFFLIDEDHLGMVVADVSGKGVPAALFMMMAKILINNFAMMGGSPAKVLEQTNNTIFQNNEDDMFITAWFGILEISSGRITAANAGHEYPFLQKPGGEFTMLKDIHGFVLGAFEDMTYQNYEIALEKGGTLFLYTDGVPEATNEESELFGTRRLITVMNESHAHGPVELLTAIKMAVSDFVGDADQFDDLTMLAITLQ